MARIQGGKLATSAAWLGPHPEAGMVRPCAVYRDELARHRLITADGMDFVVATADERMHGRGLVTGAYPVMRGYVVMMRQPLCELVSETLAAAQSHHSQLVQVLARTGTRVVKARRRSAAWRRAETMVEASDQVVATSQPASVPALAGMAASGSARMDVTHPNR